MKVVILCGGTGSRIALETKKLPKPMIKIGKKPILIHIMEHYKKQGFNHFILACGYKHKIIKRYFKKEKKFEKVQIVNTGKNTLTGKRLFKLKKFLKDEEIFMLTYGDGVSNINLKNLLKFHKKNKKIATVTAVNPPSTFGELKIEKNIVKNFKEKKKNKTNWINGGFFVFDKKVFNILTNKNSMLEDKLMSNLVRKNQINAFKHYGFWKCLDNYKDKLELTKAFKRH